MPGSLNIVLGNNYDIHDNPDLIINIGTDGSTTVKKGGVPVMASECSDVVETSDEEDPARATLPDCLSTPAAKRIWHRLQTAALIDDHYQPVGLNKAQMMYIADCMADKLRLRYRWSPFEKLWRVTRLADAKYDMQRTGDTPSRSKEIEGLIMS